MIIMGRAVAATALLAAASVGLFQTAAAASPETLEAYGVSINALGVTLAKTPLANSAQPSDALASINVAPLLTTAPVTAAVTVDASGNEQANVQVTNLVMSFLGSSFNAASLAATCVAQVGAAPVGTTNLVTATLAGPLGVPTIVMPPNPAPNTVFAIPGVSLIANEQITHPDGSLTVNALHFTFATGGGGDIIVASATCGPAVVPVAMISPAGGLATGGAAALAATLCWTFRRRATR
ncbi:choice-of-anchor P family protein [Actinocorallia lasiicapitis]